MTAPIPPAGLAVPSEQENVSFTVTDPDALIAGTSPFAAFAVSHAQLYRFTTQALARAGSSGTLVDEYALIAESATKTAAAGPFRFGDYDSSQTASSWYAYRFRDSGSANYSSWSAPWQPGGRLIWTLRELMKETALVMGIDAFDEGTATAGAVGSVTCASLFKSSLRDSGMWEGASLFVDTDAGGAGAAPENEEALIASVDVSTGVATLDADLTSGVASGDHFYVFTMFKASQLKQAINAVRRKMKTLQQTPIAMNLTSTAGNRYPLPQGCYSKNDIARCRWYTKADNAEWEYLNETEYDVEWDGVQGWLILMTTPVTDTLMVENKVTFYELEGPLTALTDTTKANLDHLTRAAAWWLWQQLDKTEEQVTRFSELSGIARAEVGQLTAVYEPTVVRPLRTGRREWVGPVPPPV